MNITIHLRDGLKITKESVDFVAEECAETLNNRQALVTAIDDIVINKNEIKMIVPAEEPVNPNIEVHLNDGNILRLIDNNYSAATIVEKFNEPAVLMAALGDGVINKTTVKMVTPIEDEPE